MSTINSVVKMVNHEESFAGFTSSDIRKIKGSTPNFNNEVKKHASDNSKYSAVPSTLLNLSAKKTKKKERYLRNHSNKKFDNSQQVSIEPDFRLAKGKYDEDSSESEEIEKDTESKDKVSISNLDSKPIKEPSLDDFEMRQKQMEEENRKRRALLTKAINERQKKTKAEQEKLIEIQKDLNRLDNLLSNDVAIIRDQIDDAAANFDEAQKRYDKAEKEFVDAKLNLFKRMERKESLTQYLCAIIEQNEERKCKKLAGLMDQLEMEVENNENAENNSSPMLPQLCAMNDTIYNKCNTIKDPRLKEVKDLNKKENEESPPTETKDICNESSTNSNEHKECHSNVLETSSNSSL